MLLLQRTILCMILFAKVAKRLRYFSVPPPPFSDAGSGPAIVQTTTTPTNETPVRKDFCDAWPQIRYIFFLDFLLWKPSILLFYFYVCSLNWFLVEAVRLCLVLGPLVMGPCNFPTPFPATKVELQPGEILTQLLASFDTGSPSRSFVCS